MPSKTDRSLYRVAGSIAAVLTGFSAAWSTIAMPITPYDTLVYLLLPSAAAMTTIRWARRTPEWSWPVVVTHQIVLTALYFVLYLGFWVLLFAAAWGGGYLLIGLFCLPLVFVVGLYLRVRRASRDEPSDRLRAIATGLGVAGVASAAYAIYQLRAIFQSQSETAVEAGIADFLLIAPIVLAGAFGTGWSIAMLLHAAREPASARDDG